MGPVSPQTRQLFLPFDAPEQLLSPDELFQGEDSTLLLRTPEDRRVEWKSPSYQPRALGDYFSMWANTAPDGGLVVLGIENDGAVTGCKKLNQMRINELERAGDTFCPEARYDTKRLEVQNAQGDADFLLLFRVFYRRDKVVKTTKGTAFVRRGSSKRELSDEEIRELSIDKGQLDIEQEPAPFSFPVDFDTGLIEAFCNAFRASRNLSNGRSQEEILELRHLGKRTSDGFVPNTACALLFAKDPRTHFPGCRMRFMRFEGEHEGVGDRFNVIKDIWIEGPVPRQLLEAETILDGQLRDFSRLGADGKFYTAPEYPKSAWYEALVNACVHRSYGLRHMHITIKMFDDRLEVESPGGFPPLVNPENIYETQHSRNPHLMDAMYYLDFVKIANEGTRRMRTTMQEMGLPLPEFKQRQKNHSAVLVTLRNDSKHRRVWLDSDAASIVGEAIFRGLSQEERRIINWVAENRRINVSQAQRLTSRSWQKARGILMGLAERGLLERVAREDLERDPKAHFVLANGPGARVGQENGESNRS